MKTQAVEEWFKDNLSDINDRYTGQYLLYNKGVDRTLLYAGVSSEFAIELFDLDEVEKIEDNYEQIIITLEDEVIHLNKDYGPEM